MKTTWEMKTKTTGRDEANNLGRRNGIKRYKDDEDDLGNEDDLGDADENEMTWEYAND